MKLSGVAAEDAGRQPTSPARTTGGAAAATVEIPEGTELDEEEIKGVKFIFAFNDPFGALQNTEERLIG